jgi:RNA-dependent RNA polymerase
MGAKGVVCVADESVCNDKLLVLRKSMVKFERLESQKHDSIAIEVVGFAKKMKPPRYNRQLIQILEYMQIDVMSEEKFREVNTDGIPKVIRSHFGDYFGKFVPSSTQSEMERLQGVCDKSSSGHLYRLSELISALVKIGIGIEKVAGSFLWNVLQRLQRKEFQLAKFEAKMPIPGSYKVLGVCDEYRVLDEGEVYVRANGVTKSGNILIYRSPVIHPGDVRLVSAISDEALEQKNKSGNPHLMLKKLNNVVVFPTTGKRPLPTMLAGKSSFCFYIM